MNLLSIVCAHTARKIINGLGSYRGLWPHVIRHRPHVIQTQIISIFLYCMSKWGITSIIMSNDCCYLLKKAQLILARCVLGGWPTQQNSYSISHLLGTVTTQWLSLWRCSHCSLVPDTVTTEQWLHRTHTL